MLALGTTTAFAQLRGHGGPVRALAISSDGQTAISGSFNSTAIRWSLTRNAAEQVLRFHADAVNAVALLGDGRAATAGAEARIAIWTSGKAKPDAVLEGHAAPIAALAASPDGATLASASWDHTVRLWPLAGGGRAYSTGIAKTSMAWRSRRMAAPWSASVTIRAFASGRSPASASPTVVAMPTPLNAVAVGNDGEIAAGGADGRLYFLAGNGVRTGDVATGPRPVISIAISPDGALAAVPALAAR